MRLLSTSLVGQDRCLKRAGQVVTDGNSLNHKMILTKTQVKEMKIHGTMEKIRTKTSATQKSQALIKYVKITISISILMRKICLRNFYQDQPNLR